MPVQPHHITDRGRKCLGCGATFGIGGAYQHVKFGRCPVWGYTAPTKDKASLPTQQQPCPDHITVYGSAIEWVESFPYLGRILRADDNDDDAVEDRIKKARGTFAGLKQRLLKQDMPAETKLHVLDAVVMATLWHGCETWVISQRMEHKLDSFQQACLRHCLKMYPHMHADGHPHYPAAEKVLQKAGKRPLSKQLAERQLKAAQRMAMTPETDFTKQILRGRATWTTHSGGAHSDLAHALLRPIAEIDIQETAKTQPNKRTAEVRRRHAAPKTAKGPQDPLQAPGPTGE